MTSPLGFFARHQNPDGSWSPDGYAANCRLEGPKCEPGRTIVGADEAVTALVLFCFIGGANHSHLKDGPYRHAIARAKDWLLSRQRPDGSWGRNYENAMATMALSELFWRSGDRSLILPVQRGVDHLLAVQNPGEGKGSGWDYYDRNPKRNDSSVTVWCLLALNSAKVNGFEVGTGLEGGAWWFERAWKAANPGWEDLEPDDDRSVFPYTYDEISDTAHGDHLSHIGLLCKRAVPGVRTLGAGLEGDISARRRREMTAWPLDAYRYYLTELAAGSGGWGDLHETVAAAQRRGPPCFRGSWDPEGAGTHHVDAVGRVLVTALFRLSFEVRYCYILGPDEDLAFTPVDRFRLAADWYARNADATARDPQDAHI